MKRRKSWDELSPEEQAEVSEFVEANRVDATAWVLEQTDIRKRRWQMWAVGAIGGVIGSLIVSLLLHL